MEFHPSKIRRESQICWSSHVYLGMSCSSTARVSFIMEKDRGLKVFVIRHPVDHIGMWVHVWKGPVVWVVGMVMMISLLKL